MTPAPAAPPLALHRDPAGAAPLRLRGPARIIARVAVLVVAVFALTLLVVGVVTVYGQLRTAVSSGSPIPWTAGSLHAALARLGLSVDAYAAIRTAARTACALSYCAIAAVIFRRKSDEWVGLSVALFLVTYGALWVADILPETHPTWGVPRMILAFLAWTSFVLFFLLFPDGRFVPRWTWVLAAAWLALQVLLRLLPPISHGVRFAAFVVLLGVVTSAQLYRYWHVSDSLQRQQAKWLAFGIATTFSVNLGLFLAPHVFPIARPGVAALLLELAVETVSNVSSLLIPVAIGIAILRYRLWDIDVIINRTLVYGALTASVVGIYVLVVGAVGALVQARGNLLVSLLATGLVAVLFHPLREWLQRAANRLIFGERDEPYAVLSRLAQQVETTVAPAALLFTIVETVATALKLPYAAITLRQDDADAIAATYGQPVTDPLRLPLVHQREAVGHLLVAPRAPGDAFTPADRRLLADVAHQAGVVAQAVRLTADLQRSRERLITAREEERRRLRRDLHDGLGPTLASQTLKLDAALDLLAGEPAVGVAPNPEAAMTLLRDIKAQTQATVADIRRLVYALRPPALDELGLAAALQAHLGQYTPAASGLHIAVETPAGGLPPLPAAVEVAAYRIALEGITNVVRHAHARACVIRLSVVQDDHPALQVEIHDDGGGLPHQLRAGVGLTSMRERAAELGGICLIEPGTTGGTHILARLPLPTVEP